MAESWPLVGRSGTLATIVGLAQSRQRAGVLLVGAPGVGRTRMARATLAAVATMDPGAGRPPWSPVWVMASRATQDIPLGALGHLLPPPAVRSEAGAAVMGHLLHEARAALRPDGGAGRLILAVDDAHVIDTTSAVLLSQLAMSGDAFLVVTAPTGPTLPDPIFALWKEGLVDRLELQAFDRAQSDQLVTRALGGHVDAAALQRLWTLSLGNALFLRELVEGARESGGLTRVGAVWRWEGPFEATPRLVEMVEARLGALSAPERDLLRLLAFGQPLGSDVAAELVSPAALAAVERRGLVESVREGRRVDVRLQHPLYTEILRQQATPLQERQSYHHLTQAMEAHGTRRADDRVRVLGFRVGRGESADPAELLAAARAAAGDAGLAARLLRAATDSGGDVGVRLELARALVGADRFAEAEAVLAEVAARDGVPDDLRTATALVRAPNAFWGLHDVVGARAIARGLAGAADPGAAAWARAFLALLDGRPRTALEEVEPALAADEGPAAVGVVSVAAFAAARAGLLDRAHSLARRGLALVARDGDPAGGWFRFEVLAASWYADLQAGHLDRAEQLAQEGYDEALLAGSPTHLALHAAWRGIVAARRGRVRTATTWLREAAAAADGDRFAFAVPLAAELATALGSLGEVAEARAVLARTEGIPGGGLLTDWLPPARVWLAGLEGAVSVALEDALAAGGSLDGRGHRMQVLHTVVRLRAVGAVADELAVLAADGDSAGGDPLPSAYADHARALTDRDAAGLDGVADRFAAVGTLLLAAEAAAQASAVHRAEGATTAARASAARSRAWARECEGARTPALELLEASTELTRREWEIASLAARGLTSKAIAEQLVVSVRTVDNVLRAVYAKLGVAGRGELAGVAGLGTPG